jgi:hypothetical protein
LVCFLLLSKVRAKKKFLDKNYKSLKATEVNCPILKSAIFIPILTYLMKKIVDHF